MARHPRHTDDQHPPATPLSDEAETRWRNRHIAPMVNPNGPTGSRTKRLLVVERMMLDGVADPIIQEVLSRQFDKSESTIKGDIHKVRNRWGQEDDEQRRTYKSSAMRRIQSHITNARRDKAWGAVSSLERLLAQIQGTLEPVQVNVEFVARQAFADYITNLSDDELDALTLEQKEMERKAAMFDKGISPDDVLDTEGVSVH